MICLSARAVSLVWKTRSEFFRLANFKTWSDRADQVKIMAVAMASEYPFTSILN